MLFLARTQAAMYMMNNITADQGFFDGLKRRVLVNGGIFVVFFLWFMAMLLTSDGYTVVSDGTGTLTVEQTRFKYFHNYTEMWWAGLSLLIGVVSVLYGIGRSAFAKHCTGGIWYGGMGTLLVVCSMFWVAGYGDTAFYPSLEDPMSSLTIRNSSSSKFTLEVMSYVSVLVPFVAAYIWYVWRSMDRKKLTPAEISSTDHKY